MSEPSGIGHQFAEDATRNQKWNQKDRKTRIQLTMVFVVVAIFSFWMFGYSDTFFLLGMYTTLHLLIKLFSEIKTWIKK